MFSDYIKDMDAYISKLKKRAEQNPHEAQDEARKRLANTGMYNSDGTLKNVCETIRITHR